MHCIKYHTNPIVEGPHEISHRHSLWDPFLLSVLPKLQKAPLLVDCEVRAEPWQKALKFRKDSITLKLKLRLELRFDVRM
jgi:hypothetical protein